MNSVRLKGPGRNRSSLLHSCKAVTAALMSALLLAIAGPAVAGAGAHVHGKAEVDVAVDGNLLQIVLHSPLDSLVGFEHAPRTQRERQALESLRGRLLQTEKLFVPSAGAGCTRQSVEVEMPFDDKGKETQGSDGHAELQASFAFQCARPDALKAIEFRLFDVFPRMERIAVQSAGARRQSAATLTSKRRMLSW